MLGVIVASLVVFLSSTTTEPPACSGDPIGSVDSVSGSWTILPRDEEVSQHACVYRGDSLRKNKAEAAAEISILFLSGEPFVRKCRANECTGVFRVPATLSTERPHGFAAFVASLWKAKPERPPIFTVARGVGTEPLPAVVVYESNRLKLGPAVAPLGSGSHRLTIQRQLPEAGPRTEVTVSGADGVVEIAEILPGLYALERVGDGSTQSGAATALLVLAGPNPAIETPYAEARAEVDAWRTSSPPAVRAFLTEVVMALYYGGGQ